MHSGNSAFGAIVLLAGFLWNGAMAEIDVEPRLRGTVELKKGGKLEGWIRFERELLLLTEANGNARSIGAAELKVAHVHLTEGRIKASLGLKGSYFKEPGLVGPVTERVDEVVDFNWGPMAPMANFPADHFSVRWDGEIESIIAGSYAFHVAGSEGARLWVNGRSLIDRRANQSQREHSGIIQLEGRQLYPIRLEYFEGGGDAAIHLLWTPPQSEKAVIPGGQLSHFPAQEPMRNGLLGSYHRGSNFKGDPIERIDRVIDFAWSGTGPMPGFGINYFSVRWEGEVEAPISGPVTFRATTDDGVRLWVGGQLIIDEWRPREPTESLGEIILQAGRRYPLRMDYYQATKQASARFAWSGPGLKKQLVPEEFLFAKPPGKPAREVSPGIVLKGGSFLAGRVMEINDKDVLLSYLDEMQLQVRRKNIGALQFVPLEPSVFARISRRPPGCVLRGGDYFVSELIAIDAGGIEMFSSVFGRRKFKSEEVRFIKLEDFSRASANFEVRTRSGSLLRANWLMLDGKRALVKDNSFCWINLEPGDVTAVYGIAEGG
jgi:hypothetical protein